MLTELQTILKNGITVLVFTKELPRFSEMEFGTLILENIIGTVIYPTGYRRF